MEGGCEGEGWGDEGGWRGDWVSGFGGAGFCWVELVEVSSGCGNGLRGRRRDIAGAGGHDTPRAKSTYYCICSSV